MGMINKEELIYQHTMAGIEYEKQGNIPAAIKEYEFGVLRLTDASHPYDRLTKIYRKMKRYKDEIRVCKAFLKANEGANNHPKIERFQERLKKAVELQNKSTQA